MKLRTPFWQSLRRDEIADASEAGAAVLLPVGSIEQHGAHLPVNTDIAIATAVCVRATEVSEPPSAVVAPPVWSGYSPHHMNLPGTLTLDLNTFQALIYETCVGIWHHGFRKILVVNGHGGNTGPLAGAAQRLTSAGHPVLSCGAGGLVGDDLDVIFERRVKGGGHACEVETSVMLHLYPESVEMTKAVDYVDLRSQGFTEVGITVPSVFAPDDPGVRGYPTIATAEKGRRFVELAAERLADIIRLLHRDG